MTGSRRRKSLSLSVLGAVLIGGAPLAQASTAADCPTCFRELYKELVETNTTLSAGDCTLASERMAARLKQAGYSDSDVRVVVPEKFPKQGNLIGRVSGSDKSLPPVLLLAHIDTVEAKRSDWARDPFVLVEENGYLYARGAIDDKAMAASFVDAFIRLRKEGFRPKRTIKMALTCGEETDNFFNGVRYLLATEPEAMQAGWVVNEGGKGQLDEQGKPVSFGIQTGEKVYQDFTLVATSPGGHSARPTDDNAINRLGEALVRVGSYKFPINLTPVSKEFFRRSAELYSGQTRIDMAAIGAGKADDATYERVATNRLWNAFMRTTCISTTINGGHAKNAQPQRAESNINCRIMPGEKVTDVHRQLQDLIADPKITVTLADAPGPQSPAPELTSKVLQPVEKIAADLWPGVPVIPTISTGATDGRFLNAAGIPTYGISGVFVDPDGNGVHGLDERVRVRSLMDAREFLYRLVKAYGNAR
ncbi:M20/M25/M40 family metallo-hydrolase [Steroidobacter sp.]|uniref:M20/M25/M40 family metallo-hydrolase n=1 Tax=Steroidobacter sp. TaxID=1978227 RepID=UPI0039C92154